MRLYETKTISLPTPVNLSSFPDIAAQPDEPLTGWAFVHNTRAGTIYWREALSAPDAADTGHPLAPGEGVVALVLVGLPFWVWSSDGTGELTVSPAAPMPTREA